MAQNRLSRLVLKYCYDLDIRLAFSSFKISALFSVKDRLPILTRSNVVYKFSCAGCNACYVGETRRHLNVRINEHVSNRGSNVYKHLADHPECKNKYSVSCFTILDNAANDRQLKIKESLHIHWIKPDLNVQVQHSELTLF